MKFRRVPTVLLLLVFMVVTWSTANAEPGGKCWITTGSGTDDTLMCSVAGAGQLGIGSVTAYFSYTNSGIPQNGNATVTAGQSNIALASIPKSAYPLSLTLSVSIHQDSQVEGIGVKGFTGDFSNIQATTYTESQPLTIPNPFSTWSLEVTSQVDGLLEGVFFESSNRMLSIAPFYIANDRNSTQVPVRSTFVISPYENTRVLIPGATGSISGTITLVFETGETKDIAVQIAGPGSYVLDGSGLHR